MPSIIMTVHNVFPRPEILDMTRRCVESLRANTNGGYELILQNNGSHDSGEAGLLLIELIKPFPSARIMTFAKNEPVGRCWNQGIELASDDIIVIVNNDIIFNNAGWINRLTEPLYRPATGLAGSKMIQWNGFEFLEGAFLAFDRKNLESVKESGKLFDEQFQFSCEDADLCQRVKHANKWLVVTDVEASGLATHLHHGTLCWTNEEDLHILDIMHESRKKLCRKYGKAERVDD